MMRMTALLMLITSCAAAQEDFEFENENILFVRYVNPEACDYPYNIPSFYSYDEYRDMEFSGTVNEDELYAQRSWWEVEYDDVMIYYQEEIEVVFGNSSDFRYMTYGEYRLTAHYGYDDELDDYHEKWLVHHARIDYNEEVLMYAYQPSSEAMIMELTINEPSVENIEFLRLLCYFYNGNDQDNTIYSTQSVITDE